MTVSPAQAVWVAYEQILENEGVVTDTDKKALAAALRAVVKACAFEDFNTRLLTAADILAIATELEGSPKEDERPDRLIAGDVWEFETEVEVKGKRKPQLMRLQFEVVRYHKGECAWQLKSLIGGHYTYLMECAPQYEDMTYIGPLDSK